MKAKLFWGSLLLISISWVVNAFYAQSKLLAEPIFLQHAIYKSAQNENELTFYYLTNATDNTYISSIYFQGIRGYSVDNELAHPLQKFPHYKLQRAVIQLDTSHLDLENAPLSTDDIQVTFSDGHEMTASIGELTFYESQRKNAPLLSKGGSSSDQGKMAWYEAEEAITIEEIQFNVREDFQGAISIFIDAPSMNSPNKDSILLEEMDFPIPLKEGENLYIHTQVAPDFIGFIEASLTISGTTASGKAFIDSSPLYSQQPYLESADVINIIKEKGKIR